MSWRVVFADCIDYLKTCEPDSFDSIVTDPPYALDFMGKSWDSFGDGKGFQSWCEQWAIECLRVLKPGGYILCFGGTRTYHRVCCAIEDAGFEIRDSLHWLYGSGFPKSRDISKAIDSEAGAERQITGPNRWAGRESKADFGIINDDAWQPTGQVRMETAPATAEAKQWQGWGTALKPAHEPIVMARKPFRGTVVASILGRGTGGINVDGCRIGSELRVNPPAGNKPGGASLQMSVTGMPQDAEPKTAQGRWPPNVILSHGPGCEPTGQTRLVRGSGNPERPRGSRPGGFYDIGSDGGSGGANGPTYGDQLAEVWDCQDDCPVAELDRQSGFSTGARPDMTHHNNRSIFNGENKIETARHGDAGGASRFFPVFRYCPKAPKRERPTVPGVTAHPTVKPVALMRWLVRMVTPPGGTVLDPFAGTGATAEACELEGFNSVLIESDAAYIELISVRMARCEAA